MAAPAIQVIDNPQHHYTYPELENLWVAAGGPPSQAPTAAAIALAESGGDPLNAYPSHDIAPGSGSTTDATGLWQILGLPQGNFTAGELTDPFANARMAVAKYQQAGASFNPWQTYTQRTYLQYLQSDPSGPPSGSVKVVRQFSGGQGLYNPATGQPLPIEGAGQSYAQLAGKVLPSLTGWVKELWSLAGLYYLRVLEVIGGGLLIVVSLFMLTRGGVPSPL